MTSIKLPLPSKQKLRDTYENRFPLYEKALFELQRRLREELKKRGLQPSIKYRVKSFDSYYEKLLRRVRELPSSAEQVELNDLLGLRVVCPFIEDLTAVENGVLDAFDVVEVERKGSEFTAQEFGYDATHCLVRVPTDIRESFHLQESLLWEVQLRTILQDAWAEVEHELIYKAEFTPFDEPLRRKLAALNANLTLSDIIFQEIRDYQRQLHSQLLTRREGFWRKIHGEEESEEEIAVPIAPAPSASEAGDRDSMDTMLLKALHAHNRKRYGEAISIYSEILKHQPKPHIRGIVHIHRGMARFAQGDLDGAIEDFSTALSYDQKSTKAYFYRGLAHRTQGYLESALRDFSICLDFDQYNADALYARALVYRSLGDRSAATADCRQALNVDPDHPDARALLRKLNSEEVETR
ncbi:MAG: tetratricopeptide repeat protein [Spirochaetaceae bacterium]